MLCKTKTVSIIITELFLEELVSHGNEGDGESTAEEEDEVNCQLVSETQH